MADHAGFKRRPEIDGADADHQHAPPGAAPLQASFEPGDQQADGEATGEPIGQLLPVVAAPVERHGFAVTRNDVFVGAGDVVPAIADSHARWSHQADADEGQGQHLDQFFKAIALPVGEFGAHQHQDRWRCQGHKRKLDQHPQHQGAQLQQIADQGQGFLADAAQRREADDQTEAVEEGIQPLGGQKGQHQQHQPAQGMADLTAQAEHRGSPAQAIEPAAQQKEIEVLADLTCVELVVRAKGEDHIAAIEAAGIGGLNKRLHPARVKADPWGADRQAPDQSSGCCKKQQPIEQPRGPLL